MGEVQVNNLSTGTTNATIPPIDNLCTQQENLTIDQQEEVINCLHIAQGEPYSQLVQSSWRRKSDVEGIYLFV